MRLMKIMCVFLVLVLGGCAPLQGAYKKVAVNPTGYPIVDEPITIRVMAPESYGGGNMDDKQMIREYEEKTNIHVEWSFFNDSNIEEMFRRMQVEKEIPDVFLMLELPNMDYYGIDGIFRPVEDLIDKYAPNIKKAMSIDTDSVKMCQAIDGHMYAVPSFYRANSEELRGLTFINKKWLDQLGLAMPQTPEELYTVLKAFYEMDPNGNGVQDEIPLLLDWEYNMTGVNSLFSPWGVGSAFTGNTGNTGPFIIKNDTQVVLSNIQEGYKEAVKYFYQLYKEGLLYNQCFTIGSYMRDQLAEGSAVGMLMSYTRPNEDFVPLLPLKGREQGYTKQIHGIFANNYISASAKYPEAIMRWMDGTADPEQSYLWNCGPLGVNVEKAGGKYRLLPTPDDMSYNQFRTQETYMFPIMGIHSGWIEENTILGEATILRNQYIDAFRPYTKAPYTSFRSTDYLKMKDMEAMRNFSEFITYSKSKEVEFITRGNVDQEWDAHVAKLKELGANYYTALFQDALDSWNETE